jgi:hypothetical protein
MTKHYNDFNIRRGYTIQWDTVSHPHKQQVGEPSLKRRTPGKAAISCYSITDTVFEQVTRISAFSVHTRSGQATSLW